MRLSLSHIMNVIGRNFQLKRKNDIVYGNDQPLTSALKPIRIGDKISIVELSESELKVRGAIDAQSMSVNGTSVEPDAVTKINNAATDRLVTIGATTTELEAESGLTFSSGTGTLKIESDEGLQPQLRLTHAGTDYFSINTIIGGATKISTYDAVGTLGNMELESDGTMTLDADDDFTLDCEGDIILDSNNGNFIAKKGGTEFSAGNSSYAGMILGYTCIGADVADDSYALTTSYVCFQDSGGTEIGIIFKTPPSEYVEIEAELYFSCGSSNKQLRLSISNNATYGSNTLGHPSQFEKVVSTPARGNGGTFTQKWLLQAGNLEAIGSSNTIYIAASTDSTTGLPVIKWGGNNTNEYTNLVMKAVALPAAIVEGS